MRVKILKGITALAVIGAVLGASMADSESILPMIVLVVSLAWLLLIYAANRPTR